MSSGNGICILANSPQCGKPKNGLDGVIGKKRAALLSRALLLDLITAVLKIPRTEIFIAFWPPEAQDDFADIIHLFQIEEQDKEIGRRACEIILIPQDGKNMRERLTNVCSSLFERDIRRALFVCSNNPLISPLVLKASFELLDDNNVVLGPTFDGSFYLLGLDGHYPQLIKKLNWKPGHIYRQMRKILDTSGMPWQELEISYAINSPEGLEQLYNDIDNLRMAGQDDLCYHTEKCLVNLKK
jgi:glycosyltransferase A (GT-A) superfamily protein (DUF2064 family)